MPDTSRARSAPFTARKEPTAFTEGCQSSFFATVVDTVCTGMPCLAIMPWTKRFMKILPTMIVPSTTPTATSMITMRFVVMFISILFCGVGGEVFFSVLRLVPPAAAEGDEQRGGVG